MTKLRIGYIPNSSDLSAPADRRRLVFWAAARGHQVVTDLSQSVDLIVLSERANFTNFSRDLKVPVILDLIDGYLARESFVKDCIRGILKVADKQLTGFPKPYTSFVQDICSSASAVICSSKEQRLLIEKYSKNVHEILDSHDEISILPFSNHSDAHAKSILWEGLPVTLGGVLSLSEVLIQKNQLDGLELNFVTNEEYFKFLGKYISKSSFQLLTKQLGNMVSEKNVVPWNVKNLIRYAEISSAAIIPVVTANPIQKLKPENRLLIMWRLGLPTLTSNTPAYSRLAKETGLDFICDTQGEWQDKLDKVLSDRKYAAEMVFIGQDYLQANHSATLLLRKWDAAIESVL
jgi:hypothetical protein